MNQRENGQQGLLGVQALRAVASFMVVAYHAVDQWTTHRPGYPAGDWWPNGSAGVDIFFVISGLVMSISVQRNTDGPDAARRFIADRIRRIVPMYWLITSLKIATVVALPALATRTRLDTVYVAGSYLLLPVRDWTGIIRPVLPVGWTLTFEMFFYILIAVALLTRSPISRICVPILVAVTAIAMVGPQDGFANSIVLEFLLGIVIGHAVRRLQTLPAILGAVVGPAAFAVLVVVPVGDGLLRPLTWGVPAACIVAAAVASEAALRRHIPQWLLAAGNASYATYLTHGFVVPAVFILCSRSFSVDAIGLPASIIISLGASAAVGQLAHIAIEQPLLRRLRSRRPAPTLPASG